MNYVPLHLHTHFSLFQGEENAFHQSGREDQLSDTARSFIAGIIKHAPEFIAVTNQWVNSYKRLHGGGEAPAKINWGKENRDAMIRIPMYKPKKENSTRIEFRAPDSACNPYLAFAVTLAAGLKGIESRYKLESDSGISTYLPANLSEALSGRVLS